MALALLTAIAGCQEPMIDTPYVMYGEAGRAVFQQTPQAQKVPEVAVMYVTDRMPKQPAKGDPKYGFARSAVLEYGVATCSLGEGVTWDELVADSTGPTRTHHYAPKVVKVERTGSMVPLISRTEIIDGRMVPRDGGVEGMLAEQLEMDKTIARWLDHTDHKEAVVFIHGFNNSFDDAILRLAQAWHFTGRQGVPIVFTWPAGSPGLLGGYQYDRESGEFANLHLKMLLLALAKNPQIERIHIVAHSRGTDVATTALRELNAEVRAGLGRSIICRQLGLSQSDGSPSGAPPDPRLPYVPLKIETLVLAAPDLDLDVFSQRFVGENVLNASKHTVIYFSEHDEALGWSDWLFSSRHRVGNFHRDDLKPDALALVQKLTTLELINCNVTGGSTHSYVLQHPAALSDLILLMRDQRGPGAENGRPLGEPFKGFWELDNDYLKPKGRAE